MAKKDKKITCTVIYTEGYEQRVTEALVDLYYSRKRRMNTNSEEELEKAVSE